MKHMRNIIEEKTQGIVLGMSILLGNYGSKTEEILRPDS